jgi:hypothetical protein
VNVDHEIQDGGVNYSLERTPRMKLVIAVQTIVSDDDPMMHNTIVARCLGLKMSSLHPENESISKEDFENDRASIVFHLDYIAVIDLLVSVFAHVAVIVVEIG